MRKIGLIFLNFDSKFRKKTVDGIKDTLKDEYEVLVFEANDELENGVKAVENCIEKTEIPIFVIDGLKEPNRCFTEAVRRIFEIIDQPVFMITNFEEADEEVLPYMYNIVGDILLETDVVDDLSEVNYETVFFSPEKGIAFEKPIASNSNNADALKELLENY